MEKWEEMVLNSDAGKANPERAKRLIEEAGGVSGSVGGSVVGETPASSPLGEGGEDG